MLKFEFPMLQITLQVSKSAHVEVWKTHNELFFEVKTRISLHVSDSCKTHTA